MARESAGQLLDLINEILDLSRMEAGRMQFVIGAFDPVELLGHAVESLRAAAGRKQLRIELDSDGAVRHMVSDQRRVTQIVTNLLSNAVKFTQSGGIAVRLRRRDGDRVEITVADTGPGIAAEDLARLFKPFVQVGGSSRPRAEGTGLGLTISRHLARALGGDITVASVPGKGTAFTVTLPVAITHETDTSGSGLFRVLT
jgi:signal transduction histidine kinase